MPVQLRTFSVGGKVYELRFNRNALYRLEKELGEPIFALGSKLPIARIHAMLWAAMEGARIERGLPVPYTMDAVGALIDAMDAEKLDVVAIVMTAWRDAFPPPKAQEGGGSAPADPSQG